ncbi:MAG: hypothetical protein Q8P68_04100 [Candidatus Peregrinibacteria bacterium]|nr:hypothetical protein [Candidatus Peregrinibacteria bacterium]MDZ4245283.1 hypothetical protein [Candidatus Gracilibacteria bacterium]
MYNKKLMQFLSRMLSVLAIAFLLYFLVRAYMGIGDMLMFNTVDFFIAYLLGGVGFFSAFYLLGGVFHKFFAKK